MPTSWKSQTKNDETVGSDAPHIISLPEFLRAGADALLQVDNPLVDLVNGRRGANPDDTVDTVRVNFAPCGIDDVPNSRVGRSRGIRIRQVNPRPYERTDRYVDGDGAPVILSERDNAVLHRLANSVERELAKEQHKLVEEREAIDFERRKLKLLRMKKRDAQKEVHPPFNPNFKATEQRPRRDADRKEKGKEEVDHTQNMTVEDHIRGIFRRQEMALARAKALLRQTEESNA